MDNNFYYNDNDNDTNIDNYNKKKILNYIIIGLAIIVIIILLVLIFTNKKDGNTDDDSRPTKVIQKIDNINFNETDITIFDDETKKLSVTYYPSNVNVNLEYSTSDNTVAVVDNEGTITPVSEGEATITVRDTISNKETQVIINIIKKTVLIDKIILKEESVSLSTGKEYSIDYTIEPSNPDNDLVEMKSLNRDICSVEDGTVKALRIGECNVAVQAQDEGKAEAKIVFNITSEFNLKTAESFDLLASNVREFVNEAKKYELDYKKSVQSKYLKDKNIKAQPVKISFETNVNGPYTLEVSKDNFNTIDKTFELKDRNADVYNLESGVDYTYRVKAGDNYSALGNFKTLEGPRPVYIDGVSNSRDLGGYQTDSNRKTLQGLIYRSANPDKITKSGKETAKALGIKTQIDLRNKSTLRLGSQIVKIDGQYYQYVFSSKKTYSIQKKLFKVFADYNNYPILFHCAIGRDRTGTAAFILQGLYGVSEVDANIDYELTGTLSRTSSLKKMAAEVKKVNGSSNRERMKYYLNTTIGLTKMEISNIYNIMLGGPILLSDSLTSLSNNTLNVNLRGHEVQKVYCGDKEIEYIKSGTEESAKLTLNETCNSGKITFSDNYEIEYQM